MSRRGDAGKRRLPSAVAFGHFRAELRRAAPMEPSKVPIGLANFKNEFQSLQRFAERDYPNILSSERIFPAASPIPSRRAELDCHGFTRSSFDHLGTT